MRSKLSRAALFPRTAGATARRCAERRSTARSAARLRDRDGRVRVAARRLELHDPSRRLADAGTPLARPPCMRLDQAMKTAGVGRARTPTRRGRQAACAAGPRRARERPRGGWHCCRARLRGNDPTAILQRGYAIVTHRRQRSYAIRGACRAAPDRSARCSRNAARARRTNAYGWQRRHRVISRARSGGWKRSLQSSRARASVWTSRSRFFAKGNSSAHTLRTLLKDAQTSIEAASRAQMPEAGAGDLISNAQHRRFRAAACRDVKPRRCSAVTARRAACDPDAC